MIIGNPMSASATTGEAWKDSVGLLRKAGLEVAVSPSRRPGHAIDLAQEMASSGFRRFIAAGGDGTINEVMTGLLRYADASGADLGDFTLAVLPFGTGNDWIRTSGIPSDIIEAVDCIIRGRTAREDVVRATFGSGAYCMANIGGIGLDANICVITNKLKARGFKGSIIFKLVTPYALLARRRNPVEIICDGQTVYSGKLFSAAIGNGLYRGGGVRQTVDGSRWDDGLLELSVQGAVSRIRAFFQLIHALKGDYATLPDIITRRFRKMVVKPLGRIADYVELDGEIPGTLPVTVEATGQQINIIVP